MKFLSRMILTSLCIVSFKVKASPPGADPSYKPTALFSCSQVEEPTSLSRLFADAVSTLFVYQKDAERQKANDPGFEADDESEEAPKKKRRRLQETCNPSSGFSFGGS